MAPDPHPHPHPHLRSHSRTHPHLRSSPSSSGASSPSSGASSVSPSVGQASPASSEPGRLGAGVALMLGSGLSNQSGAAVGALAFPVIGPVGVVAVRQWVAACVLMVGVRPRLRGFSAYQWRPVLGLAVVFATMNVSLYAAIDRVGLGLAVTLEFLGPLGVALAGARRRVDLCCASAVLAAVAVLTRPQPSSDYLGVGPRAVGGGVLGLLHPAQPGGRAARTRCAGVGRGGRGLGAALSAGGGGRPVAPPAHGWGSRGPRWSPGCCRRRCRSWPTCSRCAACPHTTSGCG